MDDIGTYQIKVAGCMNENDLNMGSPLEMVVVQEDDAATLFTIFSDQSGAIGLLRYLHGRGYVLISVVRER